MARKLNTKFVVLLVAVAVVVASSYPAFLWVKEKMKPSLVVLEKAGDQAMLAGDYKTAAANYGQAAARSQSNIDLQIKFVDAFDYTVAGDPDRNRDLRMFYANIVKNNPRSVPALLRVLRVQMATLGDRGQLRALSDTANKILTLEPGNREARKALVVATVEPYTADQPVPAEEVDKARAIAEKLWEEDASDGEPLQYIYRIRQQELEDANQRGAPDEVAQTLDRMQKFIDDATARAPNNADVQFVRYQTYAQLSVKKKDIDTKQREALAKIARDALNAADDNAKPAEVKRHLSIRLMALKILEQTDPKAAEKEYRDLMASLPDTRIPRLVLAEFLARQPSRLDEAVDVLEAKWEPAHPLPAMASMEQRIWGLEEQKRLCVYRLKTLDNVTDQAERDKRIKEVEQTYSELSAQHIEQPWLFRIEGALAMAKGRVAEAIDKLDAAQKALPADSQSPMERQLRNEVLQEFAAAQLRLGQTGMARPALQELIQRDPNNALPHLQLVDVYTAERNYDDATKEIEFLRSRWGTNNPVIESKAVRVMAMREDLLREKYKLMPEITRDQRAIKAQAAAQLGEMGEVIRITRDMVNANPGDTGAVGMLAIYLVRNNQREQGLAVIETALKAKPGDAQLEQLRKTILATTPDEKRNLVASEVENIADPYLREVARAELLRNDGKYDQALETLRKAEALSPSDSRALDMEFGILVVQKKFAEADSLLDRMSKIGVDEASRELKQVTLLAARADAEPSPAKRKTLVNDALNKASQVAQKYRQIGTASLLYAKLLAQTQQYAEAVDQYTQTLDKLPTSIDALRGLIECLLVLNRPGEARQYLDQARKLAPSDIGLRNLDLSYELNNGDPLRAIDALNDVLAENQDNPSAWYQVGEALELVMRQRARKNDSTGAAQYAQRAADLWGRAAKKFPTDIRFASIYADALRRVGDSAGAEKTIETLVGTPEWRDKPEAIELLAEHYARSNKPEKAEQVLTDFIKQTQPIPTSSLLKLCILYVQQQRLQDALNVLNLKRDDPDVQQQRIQILIAANEIPAARQAIDEALAKNPSPEIDLIAAFVELRLGRFEQAEGFVRKVLAVRPDDPAALFYRAQVRLNAATPDPDGAMEDLLKVRDTNPGNVEARLALADLYLKKGNREDATLEMERAWAVNRNKIVLLRLLDLYSNNTPPQWQSVTQTIAQAKQVEQLANDPDVIFAEASTWGMRGDQRKATDLARQALAIAPDNVNLRQRYYDLLLRVKAYRELIAESDSVIEKDRTLWWLYRLRGQAYRRLEQTADADREFTAAFNLAQATGDMRVLEAVVRTIAAERGPKAALERMKGHEIKTVADRLLIASLMQMDHNPEGSLEQTDKVLENRDKLPPDQLEAALQMQGGACLQLNPPNLPRARAAYEELLKKRPNDLGLLNNVAFVLGTPGSGGTVKEALKYSTRAYELSQKLPVTDLTYYVWDTHGWMLVKNNQVSEGIDLLRRAADRSSFPDVYLHLAEAYIGQSDWDGAELALDTARKIMDAWEQDKRSIDPALRPKYQQLAATLAASKKTPVGMAP